MTLLRPGIDVAAAKPLKRTRCRTAIGILLSADVPKAAPTRPSTAGLAKRSGRILIAEDNRVNQKLAVALLSKAGYTCDVAENGRGALVALATSRYDAVLMDCHMPEMDGFEATEALRRRETGSDRTLVIALTAGALPEDRARCFAAGMDDYLTKPVSSETLLAALDRHARLRPCA
jgi:CheY-like chemotaxis protein